SVSSTVMTFGHDGLVMNLLDTPGHEDFSEDTYRTLTAVDSAVMVIDAAKGIEAQTRKLFEVCRMRDIPIVTFINKVDREGRDPLELMDEIADALALDVTPMSWPIGMGATFKGVVELDGGTMVLPDGSPGTLRLRNGTMPSDVADDPVWAEAIDALQLARSALPEFDLESYRAGHLTPVFFGAALRDVGVTHLLEAIARWAPPPRPQASATGTVQPGDPAVSGFVFKMQANMDPNHRDRIAFVRLCSGAFRRGMKLTLQRTGRPITVHSPVMFFGSEREVADAAVAGDVIGIPNHGSLRVGDTLSEDAAARFSGLPVFAPEILRRVRQTDSARIKQVRQALQDLSEEGLVQVFKPTVGSNWLVGVVGALQLDVLVDRVRREFKAEIELEPVPYVTARWISADEPAQLEAFRAANLTSIAEDRDGEPVFLARSDWEIDYALKHNPGLRFHKTREISSE
ncbi:MAG TPA: peptide chain release factor 3, partial [Afifellaceae bacterium]|nr:peptide chain release factor 3 [Afifellaceae bacterium]